MMRDLHIYSVLPMNHNMQRLLERAAMAGSRVETLSDLLQKDIHLFPLL